MFYLGADFRFSTLKGPAVQLLYDTLTCPRSRNWKGDPANSLQTARSIVHIQHKIGDEPLEEPLKARLDIGGEISASDSREFREKGNIDAIHIRGPGVAVSNYYRRIQVLPSTSLRRVFLAFAPRLQIPILGTKAVLQWSLWSISVGEVW
jgi:hypothetical protein